MTYVLAKMSGPACKQHGGKDNNRLTEWKIDLRDIQSDERDILNANGIGFVDSDDTTHSSPLMDGIVLGQYIPSTLIGVPYVKPFFFDECPDMDTVWQILSEMAQSYDHALSESTALPPVPQLRKIKPVMEDEANNDE